MRDKSCIVFVFHGDRETKSLLFVARLESSPLNIYKGKRQLSFPGCCRRLLAELPRSVGGGFHGAHGGCSHAALFQGVKPVDGCSTWGADLRAKLRWMLPRLT